MSIVFIQEAHNSINASSTSVPISSSGSRNLLVVFVHSVGTTTSTPAVVISDNVSNTYSLATGSVGYTATFQAYTATYYSFNSTSGATSISVSITPSTGVFVSVMEFSGVEFAVDPLVIANGYDTNGGSQSGPYLGPTLLPTLSNQLAVSSIFSLTPAGFGVSSPWAGISIVYCCSYAGGDAYYVNPPVSTQQAQFTNSGTLGFGTTGAIFNPIPAPLLLTLVDSVASVDLTTKEDEKTLTESVTPSDSLTLARGQSVTDNVTVTDSFSLQSSFLAAPSIPVVEILVNQLIPADVKTYFNIQE